MKITLFFALFVVIFASVVSYPEGEYREDATVEHVRADRAAKDCNNESCRASCILNGHNGGSCNSNDHCDCN